MFLVTEVIPFEGFANPNNLEFGNGYITFSSYTITNKFPRLEIDGRRSTVFNKSIL